MKTHSYTMPPAATPDSQCTRRPGAKPRGSRRGGLRKQLTALISEYAPAMVKEARSKWLTSAQVLKYLQTRGYCPNVKCSSGVGDVLGGHGLKLLKSVRSGRVAFHLGYLVGSPRITVPQDWITAATKAGSAAAAVGIALWFYRGNSARRMFTFSDHHAAKLGIGHNRRRTGLQQLAAASLIRVINPQSESPAVEILWTD
jgi:hypothetical protein